ncbi:hypothetical protein PSPO01_06833 [Paraphaeosphaeria sporulosa]
MRILTLLFLATTVTAAALPPAQGQLSSYGRYHSYGHYSGPYGDYPSSAPTADENKGAIEGKGVEPACSYGGGKGR